MFALAGIEIEPKAWIDGPVTGTVSVVVNLFHECIRCPYQFVGIIGGKGKRQATDAAVVAWII